VRRHDPDDQQRLAGVGAVQGAKVERVVVADDAVSEEDEDGAGGGADRSSVAAAADALEYQAGAGAEHHSGGDRVGGAQPAADVAVPEGERQRTKAGRECGCERAGEDDDARHRATPAGVAARTGNAGAAMRIALKADLPAYVM
jgi:hypothetical protein